MSESAYNNIVILGSTGSIGTQSLQVISQSDHMKVLGLSANSNIALLEQQVRQFKPKFAAVPQQELAADLKVRLADTSVTVLDGSDALCQLASLPEADMVVTAVVGSAGLAPTVAAIRAGKNIGLANKETLVTAGELIMPLARQYGVSILPIDSEHSAVFQSLAGLNEKKELKRIILTASGGPFLGKTTEELTQVTPAQALKHPNWDMGKRISIDSATLVNKGLEVIEARWLFDVLPDAINVLVHPESIIHSMVEFVDGTVIAQLGVADMKLPIAYALTYPRRIIAPEKRLDLARVAALTFKEPDTKTFRALALAYEALNAGGTAPTVFNAADETAVALFLEGKISFLGITRLIEDTLKVHIPQPLTDLDVVYTADRQARTTAVELAQKNVY